MDKEIETRVRLSWKAIVALCCFSGGIATAIVGSALTALSWIIGAHPWVHAMGTLFMLLTIPLLIFSGYCLDWIEQNPKNPLAKDAEV